MPLEKNLRPHRESLIYPIASNGRIARISDLRSIVRNGKSLGQFAACR
jgi:hypothetical protein